MPCAQNGTVEWSARAEKRLHIFTGNPKEAKLHLVHCLQGSQYWTNPLSRLSAVRLPFAQYTIFGNLSDYVCKYLLLLA